MAEMQTNPQRRILLAVDQTRASIEAVNQAIALARLDRAALLVLSVVEKSNLHVPGSRPRRVDQERDRLAVGARAIVERARAAGVHATYLIWEGDPAETILEAARSEAADVIVLGSRPRTNIRRLILGSVSSEVAQHASCEVMVIPG
jgi:nucleotide-binding universal stress UspA family protein